MHEPAGFWSLRHPGEPVPPVNVADFKSVWAIYQDIADIHAVTYRCGMLQILEMVRGDLLVSWKQNGQFQDAVFRVAARIPMKWIAEGMSQSLPFDVDAFFEEVRKESP
jgi:hypothetical protein